MLDPGIALLLFLLFVGLVGMSLYVVWLHVNLWMTRQILNRTPVVVANHQVDSTEHSGGCLGNFSFLLLIMILGSIFVVLYFQ